MSEAERPSRIRRTAPFALLALAVVLVPLTLAACGGGDDSSGGVGGAEAAGNGANEGFKVAVLTPGTSKDGSWGEAVSEGAEEAGEAFGAEVTIAANLEEPAQYQQQGLAVAQAGYDVIINANAAMGSVTEELAEKFPDTKFGQLAVAVDPLPENVATNTPQLPEGTFQAGVLAAAMSETGTIGTIGGFEFPALTSEMEGFALGARYANPEIKILRTYINTWTDAGKAKAAAQAQASQGADIIFSATDQATQGMYQLAESSDTLEYVIPQYLDKASLAPNVVLTSVVYNLQGATGSFIEMYGNGQWESANVDFNIENGVGLAANPAMKSVVPNSVTNEVTDVSKAIASGQLDIPSIEELGTDEAAESVDISSLEG